MATDTTIDPALNTTSDEGEVKVTYTEAQQAHLQTLIDQAAGRAGRTARAEADSAKAETARLAAEVATLKEAAKVAPKTTGTTEEQDLARTQEIERVKAGYKADLDAANSRLAESTRAAQEARAEAQSVRTEVAITNAASKVQFVDLGVVIKLTKDQVKLDPETGRFTVLNDAGQPRLNASFEPMSLDEYYNDFAAKNKYLVRGNIVSGTGSSEGSRTSLSSNGRFEVADVFGPKSSGAKASELMKTDPNEYRRLRLVAKAAGLVS